MVASQARPAYIYDTTLGDWVPMSGVVDTGQAYTFTANQTFNGLVNANNGINAATTLSLQTGGVSRMSIDSTGRSLTPFQPAFHAKVSVDVTVAGGTEVIFNSAKYNIGGNYNTSNGRFTAPVTGLYNMYTMIRMNFNNGYWHAMFKVNGASIDTAGYGLIGLTGTGSPGFNAGSTSFNVYLNAGDYITSNTWTGSSSTVHEQSHFGGYLIG
jgi:hypothetical protein